MGFSILPKDTLIYGLEEAGIKPQTFQSVDDLLYHSHLITIIFIVEVFLVLLLCPIIWVTKYSDKRDIIPNYGIILPGIDREYSIY